MIALSSPSPFLPAIIAHELGHSVYLLPDQAEGTRDIMNGHGSGWAYHDGAIGCASLALLGDPCKKAYLPLI